MKKNIQYSLIALIMAFSSTPQMLKADFTLLDEAQLDIISSALPASLAAGAINGLLAGTPAKYYANYIAALFGGCLCFAAAKASLTLAKKDNKKPTVAFSTITALVATIATAYLFENSIYKASLLPGLMALTIYLFPYDTQEN